MRGCCKVFFHSYGNVSFLCGSGCGPTFDASLALTPVPNILEDKFFDDNEGRSGRVIDLVYERMSE
jgi:hypothetical protein